ncbi:MAG: hypothetical protein ABSG51_06815 [Terracidiphilus sp.]|jgi:hypothetical protein
MEFISLSVTKLVVDYVLLNGETGRQIAIRSASSELQNKISESRRNNRLTVVVGGEFELQIGDTSAIWPNHQTLGSQPANFDDLYDLLSKRPDRQVTFSVEEPSHR